MSQADFTHTVEIKRSCRNAIGRFSDLPDNKVYPAYQKNETQWVVGIRGKDEVLHHSHLFSITPASIMTIDRAIPEKYKQEADPEGLGLNRPGAKADAGKDEYDMALFSFPNALAHVDRVGKFGAKKYTKGGFLSVPNGEVRYNNAGVRHNIKHLSGELTDSDSGELHLAHKAWNALAELELYLRANKK